MSFNDKPRRKKKTRKNTPSPQGLVLNLEVFRNKSNKSDLFKVYDSLPLPANAIKTLRFMHGCFFKRGHTKICPSAEPIRQAIGLKTNRGVQKIIARLKQSGLLLVEENFHKTRGKYTQTTNSYHFTKLMSLHYKSSLAKKNRKEPQKTQRL